MHEELICPSCGGAMVQGVVKVKGTVPGFIFFGWSWQHLWWSDNAESRASRVRLIGTGGQRPAYRCPACRLVAFKPRVEAQTASGD